MFESIKVTIFSIYQKVYAHLFVMPFNNNNNLTKHSPTPHPGPGGQSGGTVIPLH